MERLCSPSPSGPMLSFSCVCVCGGVLPRSTAAMAGLGVSLVVKGRSTAGGVPCVVGFTYERGYVVVVNWSVSG